MGCLMKLKELHVFGTKKKHSFVVLTVIKIPFLDFSLALTRVAPYLTNC